MRLGRLAWPQLSDTPPVLLLPLGATEQHGPHLPLETDTVIATALAESAAERVPGAVAGPALPYGSSGEHAGFPGTLSLGQAALELALLELVRSADRFGGVVLVCWHGGNAEPVRRAVALLRSEGRNVVAWWPSVPGADLHAGRTETSLMLALAPDLVGDERPAEATAPITELLPALREHGVSGVSRSGVLGNAAGATAAEGEALVAELVADLARAVGSLRGSVAPA